MPAFLTSELKSAFTIGFLIYIPFVVIDIIVASVNGDRVKELLNPDLKALNNLITKK